MSSVMDISSLEQTTVDLRRISCCTLYKKLDPKPVVLVFLTACVVARFRLCAIASLAFLLNQHFIRSFYLVKLIEYSEYFRSFRLSHSPYCGLVHFKTCECFSKRRHVVHTVHCLDETNGRGFVRI